MLQEEKTITIDNIKYDKIDVLPRWGYSDDELCDLVLSSDKIIDGVFYVKIEPEKKSHIDLLMESMMKG